MKKILALGVGWLSLAPPAFAQEIPTIIVPRPPGFVFGDIGVLIKNFVAVGLTISALLVFVYLVWGGIQWITSGGDKAGVEAARNRITAALIGLAIVAAAWALIQIIQQFFGIKIFV